MANTRARSSVTGRYTTRAYAKCHPKTTEVERIKQKRHSGR